MLLFLSMALADTVTLDNDVVLEVDLARYEVHGDCQMSVTEGELQGAILIVPCHRVKSFVRTTAALVLPAQAVVEAEVVEEEVEEFAPTEFELVPSEPDESDEPEEPAPDLQSPPERREPELPAGRSISF